MFRVFDLSIERELVEELINSPTCKIIEMKTFCSAETGYTTVHLRYNEVTEPIKRRRRRCVRRFVLFYGLNDDLNKIMDNPGTKLIKREQFLTAQGVIIVLDYELKHEGL